MVKLFYTTYISVDLAHYEIFHAKVGKCGISYCIVSLMKQILNLITILVIYIFNIEKLIYEHF